jgi:hypothetical protein
MIKLTSALRAVLGLLTAIMLVSCFGMESDIVFRADNSGSVVMTYRMEQGFARQQARDREKNGPSEEEISAAMNAIPGFHVERTLVEMSGKDQLSKTYGQFDTMKALTTFLNYEYMPESKTEAEKKKNSTEPEREVMKFDFKMESGKNIFMLTLGDGKPLDGAALLGLAKPGLKGYEFRWNFTLPSPGSFVVKTLDGKPMEVPATWNIVNGRNASFTTPVAEALDAVNKGFRVELIWDASSAVALF